MSITDDQLRAYLIASGWAEHPDARGLWERDDLSVATSPHVSMVEALAMVCKAEGRDVASVLRDVRETMPMAQGGVA